MSENFVTREELKEVCAEFKTEVRGLSDRLYKDNGRLSLQTRIRSIEVNVRYMFYAIVMMLIAWAAENVPALVGFIRGVMQ